MKFLTVTEMAETLGMTTGRVYEVLRLGLIPAVRIGRQVRVEEQAFKDWVAKGGQTYAHLDKTRAS
ncbi:MAG: helix-turn-helix domain-containing protein [Candidatus Eremiobacteraeota bacterium]|jgi:excisionase family DNA binding protein|nr:helix-turn-helix domain-containing protein [Candidatus Eremiobacteraeota bacterium]